MGVAKNVKMKARDRPTSTKDEATQGDKSQGQNPELPTPRDMTGEEDKRGEWGFGQIRR